MWEKSGKNVENNNIEKSVEKLWKKIVKNNVEKNSVGKVWKTSRKNVKKIE